MQASKARSRLIELVRGQKTVEFPVSSGSESSLTAAVDALWAYDQAVSMLVIRVMQGQASTTDTNIPLAGAAEETLAALESSTAPASQKTAGLLRKYKARLDEMLAAATDVQREENRHE